MLVMRIRRSPIVLLFAAALANCSGVQHTVPNPAATQAPSSTPLQAPPLPQSALAVPRRPAFIDSVPARPPLSGSRSTLSVHPPVLHGEGALSNGVYYLRLPNGTVFGYYSYLTDPHYIYHFDMGYAYVIDAGNGGGLYLYDFTSGHWWYTSPTFSFPY